ncbi:MAG: hypothetical protein JSW47_14075, partial [Phycisphaerales bacterium]
MLPHKCHHTIPYKLKAACLRQALFLSFAFCVFTSAAAKAQDFVPFVIPAKPNLESPIAISSFEPISTSDDRITVNGGHFYRGARRVRIWGVNL